MDAESLYFGTTKVATNEGLSQEELREAQVVSYPIRSKMESIFRKLDASDRAQAVAVALKKGLVE